MDWPLAPKVLNVIRSGMNRNSRLAVAPVLLVALTFNNVTRADAVALPALGLGNTSFMDGVAGPGKLVEIPIQLNYADDIKDAKGRSVSGRQRISSVSVLPHFAYISNTKILGAYYGAEVLLPLVHLDLEIDNGPRGTRTRQGDMIVSPLLLQWEPVQLLGRRFWQRLNFVFSLPTGDYDEDESINVGANVWTFNPHYAFTWELSNRLEFSGRVHYAWVSRNKRPSNALGVDDTQPGQAFHANYSLSYALNETWRVGLAGYHLAQTTDDRVNGRRQSDSRERVMAIGPGAMYRKGPQTFFANLYFESGARNRAEGTQLTLRYLHTF
ncbi:SphA family protein [Achromobacter marplatensis]|uniref:SphA family protein n=1 Tax=Achromobacter marplatensis TaxID=470868 RepID=UPI0039F732FF